MSDGPVNDFFNILRVMLFAFICGVVFAILAFLASYSIPDTSLRYSIIEERIMNQIVNSNVQSIEQVTTAFLAEAITGSESLRKRDNFAIRIRAVPLIPENYVSLNDGEKLISYDANLFTNQDYDSKFTSFYPLTGKVKSNYESVVSKRFWTEPVTKKTYVLQFEFVTERN